MSLETKIRELMEAKKAKASALNEGMYATDSTPSAGMKAPKEAQFHQGSSEQAKYTEMDIFTGSPKSEDDTLKKGPAEAKVKQGDSKDAEYTEQDPHNAGTVAPDSSLKKGNSEPQHRQGDSRDAKYGEMDPHNADITTGGDAYEPQAFAKEDTDIDGYVIAETPRQVDMRLDDLRKDIESVFAADTNLSEEFKTQAGAIFEAAVIARVNHEVETIAGELAEQNLRDFEELKEGLVEKVDSYLNYVVEQWMNDNEIEVEKGLRTEVAEDFMLGLKNLFQEHYFEVPSDKVDVLEDMSDTVDEVTARLDETIQVNVELKAELDGIKRERIIEQACKDLTATDAEKMSKLLEGVDFDNEKLFSQKVAVVKENYFPGSTPTSPEKTLEEDIQVAGDADKKATVPAHMKSYVEALSRTAKVKHLG
jgi:hypothetical protein